MRIGMALITLIILLNNIACEKAQSKEAPAAKVKAQQPADAVEKDAPEETEHVVTYGSGYSKSWENKPGRDWLEEVPELPNLDGWYRHIGSGTLTWGIFSFANYIGVETSDGLLVITQEGDRIIWEYKTSSMSSYGDIPIVGGDGWICFDDHGAIAVDMISGEILWEKDSYQPITAIGSIEKGAVWLGSSDYLSSVGKYIDAIELLDIQSGEVLQRFAGLTLVAACGSSKGNNDVLVGKTPSGFTLFNADGTSTAFEAQGSGGENELLCVGDVLISLETIPYQPVPEGKDPQKWEAAQAGNPKAVLSSYSLEGKLLWSNEIIRYVSLGINTVMAANNKLVVLKASPGLLVYSTMTGEMLYQTPEDSHYGGSIAEPLGESVCWNGFNQMGMYSNLVLFDPITAQSQDIFGGGQMDTRQALIMDGRLVVFTETHPSQRMAWDENYHLLALNLSADNLPIPGNLQMWGVPDDQSELVDRYYASGDPLADETLINEIKVAGVNTFSALMDRVAGADIAYLDALGRLAARMKNEEKPPLSEYSPPTFSPADVLLKKLHEAPSDIFSECIIDWLNDPEMEVLHYPLLGVLAACGGSEAGEYLYAFYKERAVTKREVPQPPFQLAGLSKVGGVPFQVDQMPAAGWAEVETDGGGRIVAFVSDGLVSARDIYIGIDADSDGSFEEVLPTGLNDTYFHHVHPGGITLYGEPESIELIVAGGNLQITYHEPVLEEVVYDSGGESHTYMNMTGGEFVTATLSMAELRLDSDGDSLTDITERLLFTDHNNPDTDGDGISDDIDPCPNVDPAKMGKLERGIARALDYYFRSGRQSPFWEGWNEGQPWVARYIAVEGAGPVAYSQGDPYFGICMSSPEQIEKYNKALNHFNRFSLLEVSVVDIAQQIAQIEEALAAGQISEVDVQAMEQYMQEQSVLGNGITVYLNLALHGASIPLAEIDGELYPVKADMTWIS